MARSSLQNWLWAKVLEYDKEIESLYCRRADCIAAWEKETGDRYVPGPPEPPVCQVDRHEGATGRGDPNPREEPIIVDRGAMEDPSWTLLDSCLAVMLFYGSPDNYPEVIPEDQGRLARKLLPKLEESVQAQRKLKP